MRKYFQIVIFTASDKSYADSILDLIDPSNEIFTHRLYRSDCITTSFGFIKDISIIKNRHLRDLVIVDNNIFNCALQLENAIPMVPFHCD
jgi:CTD small phosphatase-like protein 2